MTFHLGLAIGLRYKSNICIDFN